MWILVTGVRTWTLQSYLTDNPHPTWCVRQWGKLESIKEIGCHKYLLSSDRTKLNICLILGNCTTLGKFLENYNNVCQLERLLWRTWSEIIVPIYVPSCPESRKLRRLVSLKWRYRAWSSRQCLESEITEP